MQLFFYWGEGSLRSFQTCFILVSVCFMSWNWLRVLRQPKKQNKSNQLELKTLRIVARNHLKSSSGLHLTCMLSLYTGWLWYNFWISHEINHFPANLTLKILQNWTFFLRPNRSPVYIVFLFTQRQNLLATGNQPWSKDFFLPCYCTRMVVC